MIEVDNRVGSVEVFPYFPRGTAKLTKLEYADFAFTGMGRDDLPILIGVERKTVADFVNCMTTGRLSGFQVPGLANSYNVIYLVIEGDWRKGPDGYLEICKGKWRRASYSKRLITCESFLNHLNTLDNVLGFKIRMTLSKKQTADTVLSLWKWWSKGFTEHHSHEVIYDGPTCSSITLPATFVRRVANLLPGVGWKISERVADKFGSVENMLKAEIEEWEEIVGIGKTVAHNSHAMLRRDFRRDKCKKKHRGSLTKKD